MILTIEQNPETIKRYSHIKPAPWWGSSRCRARCPANPRTCTLAKDHKGPHVAHGRARRVLAVWQGGGSQVRPRKKPTRPGSAPRPTSVRESGFAWIWTAIRRGMPDRLPSIEETFLLVLALSMVVFAIDWALRIIGWR